MRRRRRRRRKEGGWEEEEKKEEGRWEEEEEEEGGWSGRVEVRSCHQFVNSFRTAVSNRPVKAPEPPWRWKRQNWSVRKTIWPVRVVPMGAGDKD